MYGVLSMGVQAAQCLSAECVRQHGQALAHVQRPEMQVDVVKSLAGCLQRPVHLTVAVTVVVTLAQTVTGAVAVIGTHAAGSDKCWAVLR